MAALKKKFITKKRTLKKDFKYASIEIAIFFCERGGERERERNLMSPTKRLANGAY